VNEAGILYNLGLMVGAAAVLVLLTRRLKVPTILAYIAAGLLLGPATGLVEITHAVELIAEVGIALLLFLVGMELNFERVKDAGPVAVVVALAQMGVTFAVGLGAALLLGFGVGVAVALGVALMFSSTVVVVKMLAEQNETQTLYGRIAIGVLLMQDLVVVVVLTVLAGMGNPDALEVTALARSLGGAFLGMGVLLAAALLASKYVLPAPFRWMAGMPGGLFVWALLWCFVFVAAAEALHLSVEIGAFLAGISLAQLPNIADLERRVHPLVNFFVAVFFVSLGIQMELGAAAEHLGTVVVFSLLALVGKPVLIAALVAWRGQGRYAAFTAGVTLAQISEFSLIFAAMALSVGLIDAGVLSLIAVVGLVTIGASAVLALRSDALYARANRAGLLRWLGPEREGEGGAEALSGHVIVVGMNPLGRRIVEALHARGEPVLAVDTDPAKLDGLPVPTLHGDAASAAVLHEANLDGARLLVSALQIETANNLIAYRCREAGIPCAIHAFDRSVAADLAELGVDFLIQSKTTGTKQIVRELGARGVLAS